MHTDPYRHVERCIRRYPLTPHIAEVQLCQLFTNADLRTVRLVLRREIDYRILNGRLVTLTYA